MAVKFSLQVKSKWHYLKKQKELEKIENRIVGLLVFVFVASIGAEQLVRYPTNALNRVLEAECTHYLPFTLRLLLCCIRE